MNKLALSLDLSLIFILNSFFKEAVVDQSRVHRNIVVC